MIPIPFMHFVYHIPAHNQVFPVFIGMQFQFHEFKEGSL